MPEGAEEGIIKGIYRLKAAETSKSGHTVKLMGSGAILNEVLAGADLLEKDFGISADIYSVTSFTEVAREADSVSRWNLLHPEVSSRVPFITQLLRDGCVGPFISSTDYMKLLSEQVRPYVEDKYHVLGTDGFGLGTDGFGRSDYRRKLRHHFEVDRYFVTVAALKALAEENKIPSKTVSEAIAKYNINPDKPDPARA